MNEEIEKVIREYIAGLFHLSLATVSDSAPWVCEVHFAYDDNLNLYFRSKTSRRHSQEIDANSKVAGNIVRQFAVDAEPMGVYFEGEARMLTSDEEKKAATEVILGRLSTKGDILEESTDPAGHQFYKVSVANWYVFGRVDGKFDKHRLEWGSRPTA